MHLFVGPFVEVLVELRTKAADEMCCEEFQPENAHCRHCGGRIDHYPVIVFDEPRFEDQSLESMCTDDEPITVGDTRYLMHRLLPNDTKWFSDESPVIIDPTQIEQSTKDFEAEYESHVETLQRGYGERNVTVRYGAIICD